MGRRHLQRTRHRLQRRLLGASCPPRLPHRSQPPPTLYIPFSPNQPRSSRCERRSTNPTTNTLEALRLRGLRQQRAYLGVQRRERIVGRGRGARGAHGLGARRRVGTEHWPPAQLHCYRITGEFSTAPYHIPHP